MTSVTIGGITAGTVTEDLSGEVTGDLDQVGTASGSETWITTQASYGTASIDEDGIWTYVLNDSHPAVEALDDGQILTDIFTVTLTINGQTDTQDITITINGTTDPCYVKGTKILTDRGWVRIEMLRVGDLVQTQDKGLVPIDWIGNFESDIRPNQKPVVLPKDCFGRDCPNQDLLVSPQHLMLLGNFKDKLPKHFQEVFVPAQYLVEDDARALFEDNYQPYFYDGSAKMIQYYHLLLESHQVIFANNTSSESLNLGPIALEAFHRSKLKSPEMLDAALSEQGRLICARPILKKTEFLALGLANAVGA